MELQERIEMCAEILAQAIDAEIMAGYYAAAGHHESCALELIRCQKLYEKLKGGIWAKATKTR